MREPTPQATRPIPAEVPRRTRVRPGRSSYTSFLASALSSETHLDSLADLSAGLERLLPNHRMEVTPIPFAELGQWSFAAESGDLVHDSGRFFRVQGLSVTTNTGVIRSWEQPILNQPEIGILGIITRNIDGVRHFLLQAKMEPGNPRPAQLSPTVQATRSNYTRAHRGSTPLYLEYFLDRSRGRVLVDQLQSEHGGRYLRKRNRNMIVEVNEEIPLQPNFYWLNLRQIKQLLASDNVVNMDSRSVLGCVPLIDPFTRLRIEADPREDPEYIEVEGIRLQGFGADLVRSLALQQGLHSTDEIVSWMNDLKSELEVDCQYRPLRELRSWVHTDRDIHHESGEYFSVIAVSVDARGREVGQWHQPILAQPEHGMAGFLVQKHAGVLHFLVQAKLDPGNLDTIELAPTVCTSSPSRNERVPSAVPYLELVRDADPEQIRYSTIQSEEGGRFYHAENFYRIVELPPDEPLEVEPQYFWMTAGQLSDMTRAKNCVSVEARGLLAALNFL